MIPSIQPYYSYTISDEQGKIIRKSRTYKCHSFTRNVMSFIASAMGATQMPLYSSAGIAHYTGPSYYPYGWYSVGKSGWNSNGAYWNSCDMIIGGGTNTPTINDNWLQTELAGFTVSSLSVGYVITDPASNYYDISKVFTNTSGVNKAVNELGLYNYYAYAYYGQYASILLLRDVLPATVNVANGQSITLKYTTRAII